MARVRRYRQRWLFALALVVAAVAQAGTAITYELTRPIPPPPPWTLTVRVQGEGTGTVIISLLGDGKVPDKIVGRCSTAQGKCRIDVPQDRYVTASALRGEKMTFEGWDGCAPYEQDVLACDLRMFRDRELIAKFGKVPEEIDVAWIQPTESKDVKLPTLPKPEDPFEAEKLEEAPVELAMVPMPPPPPELIKPPAPPPPPPPEEAAKPPPPPMPPPDMRMVEVPDENEVEKAPDDATHLSDKNRDVAEETAATETNLEKQLDGKAKPSVKSEDTTSPEVGGPDDKIAQLEESTSEEITPDRTSDHSGEEEKASGQVIGEEGDEGEDGDGGSKDPGLMAMRGIGGRGRLLDDKTGDGKRAGKKGAPGLHKSLDLDDYERIVGKDVAEKERVLARAKMSAKKGRWDRKMEAIKSSLENFTPDIRPGNQTALKTRAHPFAVYVTRMHRRIHELWGFGFLADLDGKSSSYDLNDFDLYTVIELAVNPDGSVYKTTIAKTSGKLTFDVAAIDTILTAAPYQETPEAIRSVDGRVYLRWGFYRNWRQCGTFNVEPYILTDIPGGAQPIDDGAALVGAAPKLPGKGAKPVTPAPRGDDAQPRPAPVSDNRQASYAANMWVAGFTSGSVQRMTRVTSLPLKAGGQVAAATAADLQSAYEALLVESGPMREWKLLSPNAFTQKTGVPTSSVPEGAMVLLLTAQKARFGIVLTPTRSGEYRATEVLR